jgi:hypothetical protein
MKAVHLAVALAASLAPSIPCLANDLVAGELFRGTQVSFELKGAYRHVTLSIAGPDGFHATAESARGAPAIDLARSGSVADGLYTYQLFAATNETVRHRTTWNDGRDRPRAEHFKSIGASGTFRVKDGAIVKYDQNAREDARRQK